MKNLIVNIALAVAVSAPTWVWIVIGLVVKGA